MWLPPLIREASFYLKALSNLVTTKAPLPHPIVTSLLSYFTMRIMFQNVSNGDIQATVTTKEELTKTREEAREENRNQNTQTDVRMGLTST